MDEPHTYVLKRLPLLIFLVHSFAATAQTRLSIEWEKTHGGRRGEEDVRVLTATRDGGCLMVGYSWSEDKFLPLTQGKLNVIVLKFDEKGRMLWYRKPYNRQTSREALYRAAEDKEGNIYLAGTLYDPGIEDGAWLLKMDANGNTLWSKTYGGSGNESFYDIDLLTDGRIWVSGTTNSFDGDVLQNAGKADIWLMEVDAAGKVLHSHTYGSAKQEELSAAEPLSGGGFLLTSSREVRPRPSNYSISDFLDTDNFVVFTDQDGNLTDSLLLRDSLIEEACWHIFPTADGYIGTGGYEAAKGPNWSYLYAVQYDKHWNKIREKILGGGRYEAYGEAIQTAQGNILMLGWTGSDENIPDPEIGIADAWLVCLSPDLRVLWTSRYGQEQKFLNATRLAAAWDGSGYFLAGDISKNTTQETTDFWLAKFVEKPTHNNNPCYDFNVSPNPFSGDGLLKVELRYGLSEDVSWELFDTAGKTLGSGVFRPGTLVYTPLSEELPDGLYWLRLFCPEGVGVKSVIKTGN